MEILLCIGVQVAGKSHYYKLRLSTPLGGIAS
ncbi:Uncharacterised protein [Cardiobacterium valvarum]|uniref:Uncharacterized protein n=1 Tax=Cardiobacterium valvarum TaxID=194702 RepID=A0A381E0J4_9GAMM|nr:Uncharacterised protein [Cardiobacterium valvarum]